MRFFESGPNIPDQLLERRDQGRVVFLCGAGVSINAGLPTFYKLTKYVVDFFDPPKDSDIESAFRPWVEDSKTGKNRPKAPLDQIFHLLYQEYGREEVNTLVADHLREGQSDGINNTEHSIIARISSDQEGRPQIVTTNFDLLFEPAIAEATRKIYEPPAFPDISLGVPLTGITYLHGRLKAPNADQHLYVLSSSDFGRAYLSEGWATNFIRSLLKSYTVVLVGYQAEDPPVKYLLQGLNHDELSDRSNLYAFDKGEPEDIEAKWRDRGVTAIACKDYPTLWQSLEAWAERADDPRQWRSVVVKMAMKGPRQLYAHERGQVAHLARTTPGARLFAKTDPSPPPEWLCVFDARCRVAKISSNSGDHAARFDPFQEYGLDDDPPRPSESDRESYGRHDHILEWRRGDSNPSTFHRIGGRQVAGFESMPPRLIHLSNWITKHIDSPITAWWAARQIGVHPRLVENIRLELRRNDGLHPEARRIWHLILEYQSDNRNFTWDHSWFDISDRIKLEGWNQSVLREFEAVTAPILSLEQPLGMEASKPPSGGWEQGVAERVAMWNMKFPDLHGEPVNVPEEALESVFRVAERQFRRAAGILEDLDKTYFSVPTCYPEREVDGEEHERLECFKWFLDLFARMVSDHPQIARGYAETWPYDEKFFFRKLKLFALNQTELYSADEVAENLLAASQECFWDTGVRRELLFLLADRWEGFSAAERKALAERLLNGPDKKDHWPNDEYEVIRDEMACRYTRWLVLQGKELENKQQARLEELISGLPEWFDGWASGYVKEDFGSVISVSTDEAPDIIINLPASEVVERVKAEQGGYTDIYTRKRPFTGLVKINPRKAMASLSHLARNGEYPITFWSALISNWPEEVNSRLHRVFLHRLRRFPNKAIRDLRYPVGRWLQEKLPSALDLDETLAWQTFDHLVSGLISEEGIATGSVIEERRRLGQVIERSRRTIDHALNGPIGCAVEGLLRRLNSMRLDRGAGIPEEIKSRIDRLIIAPGEGGDHAITILTRQIGWLYSLDPAWIEDRFLPWFDFDHECSEPAWNGFLAGARLPPQEIGVALKPMFLGLFPAIYRWNWDDSLTKVATQIIIVLAVSRGGQPDGLNAKEARHCLRCMNDRNRQDAVAQLCRIGKAGEDAWSEKVIPFINNVWPRERAFRTSNLVSSWVNLLNDTDEEFPEVLCAVRRYLVPVDREKHWLYQFSREIGGKQPLTTRYPTDVLELLNAVIPNSAENAPNELAQILDLIEETKPSLVSDRRFVRLVNLIEQT